MWLLHLQSSICVVVLLFLGFSPQQKHETLDRRIKQFGSLANGDLGKNSIVEGCFVVEGYR